jgi:arginyl-tRNA synthetase
MIRDQIRELLVAAIERAQQEHALPSVAAPEVTVERPSNPSHGDYASAVALKMARAARMSPMEIAGRIAERVATHPAVQAVEVAPPGFLNVRLSVEWLQGQVDEILRAGTQFARVELGNGKRVQVEFVSANPTGPLHVGTGRGAALGDSLARVLEHAGYAVEREYYVNDAGSRMEAFYSSAYARYAQALGERAEMPEDGYPGDYLNTIGSQIAEQEGRTLLDQPRGEASVRIGRLAMGMLIEQIQADLALMNVRFDRWFYEQSLFDEGRVQAALDALRERGFVVEREGAVWFTSTQVGDERDNVLVRSNGLPTYFASDVAYHFDKLVERGFDQAIDIWGADHQGHVPRMKAVVGALGVDPSRLTVLLYQLVNLIKDGQLMAMGKRTGAFVTLREVLDDVGADAVRFFLVGRSPDAMMDFDLNKAKAQSEENPVWWVQMAHARLANILRDPRASDFAEADTALLEHPRELALIRRMLELPEVVEDAATALAPHPIPHYSLELAQAIHGFYQDCHVLSAEPELAQARLKLVSAARTVLATTLDLIGVASPDYMEPRT